LENTGTPWPSASTAHEADGPSWRIAGIGKPRVAGHRRVGVTLARGADIDDARRIAREAAAALTIELV
jgi:phosphoribosylglycinamide formyltransferase 2